MMKDNNLDFKMELERAVLDNMQNEDLSASWLAAQMNYSERQFYRLVRKHTGETVNNFIRKIRLETAKALMEAGDYSIKEIAYLVGYQKTSWFSTQYFLRFGERPRGSRHK
jgi:transcriptional regulator GlxA family with amidase domain